MSSTMLRYWWRKLARMQEVSHRIMQEESLRMRLDKTRHPSRPGKRYVQVNVYITDSIRWTYRYRVVNGVPLPIKDFPPGVRPSVVIDMPYWVVYYLLLGKDRQGNPYTVRKAYAYGHIDYRTDNPFEPLEGAILVVEDIFTRRKDELYREVFGKT